ncbi:16S rRNA (cytosine(1402)-N(4))-methyltransferase RsmH [Aurantivibrio infirmus]
MTIEKQAHTTVLLKEAVDALVTDPDGFYIDGTFGRGGHSREILSALSASGRLLAIDKDPSAIEVGKQSFADDARFSIAHGSFATMDSLVAAQNMTGRVNGILIDLGVSSPQLDEAERGFSFSNDGPLDMRMDSSTGITAAEWVNSVSEAELIKVLKEYGEEKFAKRISSAIVAARAEAPLTRTLQLAKIISEAHPAWEVGRHPATKSFMAIRLFINGELEELSTLLSQVVGMLAPGGRFVVIGFHSLEDRLVKRFIREQERGKPIPRGLPVTEDMIERTLKSCGKPIKPSQNEVAGNVRSRSAIMRVAEKL